jgi:hypothetical protein
MAWRERDLSVAVPWLLERDEGQPGVRFFALRDIAGLSEKDKE